MGRVPLAGGRRAIGPEGWVDRPSGSILQLYSVVYGGAARAFAKAGQNALAARADSVARGVGQNLSPGPF